MSLRDLNKKNGDYVSTLSGVYEYIGYKNKLFSVTGWAKSGIAYDISGERYSKDSVYDWERYLNRFIKHGYLETVKVPKGFRYKFTDEGFMNIKKYAENGSMGDDGNEELDEKVNLCEVIGIKYLK